MLVDSLQKQEERDPRGRFLKGVSGNPMGSFRKGHSGNPAGRRPGTRNKATESAELLLEGEAEALTRKAVALASDGDGHARMFEAQLLRLMRQCRDGREIDPGNPSPAELLAARLAAAVAG